MKKTCTNLKKHTPPERLDKAKSVLWFKRLLPLLVLFIWAESSAQYPQYPSWWMSSHYVLKWEPMVGCAKPMPREGEEIVIDRCLKACKGSVIEYFVRQHIIGMTWGDDLTVEWEVTGGTILDIYDETDPEYGVKIQWSDTQNIGTIKLKVYSDRRYQEFNFCIKFITPPTAKFEIAEENKFCQGSPIFFNNLSVPNGIPIKSALWDFGDGNYSSVYHPQHSYQYPGTYEVTLTVTNYCRCESTFSLFVTITEEPSPIISCPGVVVEDGDKITYTTEDPCGGEWWAEGGTVVDGGSGDYATIIWDNIDYSEGFGYIHYYSHCGCMTTIKVPVVTRRAIIKGDPLICVDEENKFTLPQWPTTEFNWSIVYGDGQSMLLPTDQPNEVFLQGLQPGTHTLRCTYYNTLWGFSGYAEIQVTVAQKAEITGDDTEFCNNSGTYTYHNASGDPVNWVLRRNGVLVTSSFGSSFSYHFPLGGSYVLTATPPDGCTSEPFMIDVINVPTPTGTVEGPLQVCENLTYQYSYENNVPGTILIWEASGGAVLQGNNTGETVSVKFSGNGPYTLTIKRRSQSSPICWSPDELTQTITKAVIAPTITNDTNPLENIFCPSSSTVFTADFDGLVPDYIQWSLISDANNSNFGNIVEGANENAVTINWNEISSGVNTGELLLKVTYCGQTQVIPVAVELYEMPVLTMNPIGNVCPEDDNLIVTVNTPSVENGSLRFEFSQGMVVYRPINASGIYEIENGFNNPTPTDVTQSLTVSLESPNGCLYSPSITQSVNVFPETKINITPGYHVQICDLDSYNHTLYANFATGVGQTGDFEWYKMTPTGPQWLHTTSGATSSSYVISDTTQGNDPMGIYYVELTDVNGCVVYSNEIYVTEGCNNIPPDDGDCDLPAGLDITELSGSWECDLITATIAVNIPPTSITWTGGQHLSVVNGQGTPNVTFKTDVAGVHPIFVKLNYDGCEITFNIVVEKYYDPQLNIAVVCNANNTYDLTLLNNSTAFGVDTADITFAYYQGSTYLGSGQSLALTGVSPGTYTYTLRLSSPGLPVCEVTQTVVLPVIEEPEFTLADSFCAEDTIYLTIDNYDSNLTYRWWFDNTHIVAFGETTEVNIADEGINYEITLRAYLPFGCTTEHTITGIEIKTASGLTGSFTPPSIAACEGEPIQTIEFEPANPSGPIPSGYIWMQGNEPVTGETGDSYTPTESGLYWAVLIDAEGCMNHDMVANPVDVNIRLRPSVTISGNSSLCYGDSTTIKGEITDNNLKRQWFLNGNPMSGAHGVLSDTTPLTIEIENLLPGWAAGTYEYKLYVEPADAPTCGNEAVFTLTAHQELITPELDYALELCSPYTVKVFVMNVQPGEYYWSNGTSGDSTHALFGGIYQVTYVAPTGCEVTAEISIPEDPGKSIWIFPTGCFDLCIWSMDPQPYIIGPTGSYDAYKWLINNVNVQGGSGIIDPLIVDQAGVYQLIIGDQGCIFESGFAYITPDIEECQIEPCHLDYVIEAIKEQKDFYEIHGGVYNGYGTTITVNFSSFNGFGTYSPGSVTIPPGGWYNFAPLIFTPNPGFMGGDDYLVISVVEDHCITLVPVHFPMTSYYKLMPNGTDIIDTSGAMLKVTPNPSAVLAAVSYDLGTEYQRAETLKIYTLEGRLVSEVILETQSGSLPIDISGLPTGTYIITLQADGNTILHQKLIKK